ncbi:hypothetical protein [Paenibacillus sanguinis]|uniref:hypothetical protein n=1 Tax=Paenibacillus sanguinis TaxID=225906 RepID=UPI0003719EB8|nr:hypothetical protein [Paenibacillus sanguinis]
MKSSSFLGGVLVGAFATMLASKRKRGLMSAMGGAGSMLKFAGISSAKGNGNMSHADDAAKTNQHLSSGGAESARVYPSPGSTADSHHSKEYDMKQLLQFIKSDANVRREVEAILKETHTVIPGL